MIKRILFILLIGLLIAGFGLVVMREPGFAIFSFGEITIEMELIKFYFALIAGFIVLYIFFRLLGYVFRLPRRIHAQRNQKHQLETLLGMENTILAARKFDWNAALRSVMTNVKSSPIKLSQNLLATQYAQSLGNIKLRDTQLAKIRSAEGGNMLANALEAEFALDENQANKALLLVTDKNTDDPVFLNILARAYLQNKDAVELDNVLSKLVLHVGKSNQLHNTFIDSLKYLTHFYDENANGEQLASLWKRYSKFIASEAPLLQKLVHGLARNHENVLAEQIITAQLKDHWDEQLVQEYGLLTLGNNEKRINQAETWLQHHKESAGLLLTLGRLHKKEKLWGKAKSYLESSLSRKPLAMAYAELAEIHEYLDESADAQRCAKKGLHIATRDQSLKTKRTF